MIERDFPGEEILDMGGQDDFDQHYRTAHQIRHIATYEMREDEARLYISDPIWGKETIGDQEGDEVFLELYRHPVFQRLAAIEQLTLPKMYATMPGSYEFTRWEHVWGSAVFVRKMLQQAEDEGRVFAPEEKVAMQLRTLLSDAGHTAFSHLGDWIKQSFGGTEDSHDLTLPDFLEKTGVNGILRRHGIDPAKVTMPEGACDFVECPSPDLCTDRVDYGCREISRWVDPGSEGLWRDCFSIDEQNRLIMKDKQTAEYFALSFGLLATEHWGHPVHRLQLQLFAELVKGAVLNGTPAMRYKELHPHDGLYTVDGDVMTNIRSIGVLNNDLHAQLLDIARSQRRIFAWSREKDIRQFLAPYNPTSGRPAIRDERRNFLHPLESISWDAEYSGVKPQNIQLVPVRSQDEMEDFGTCPHTYDVYLPSLKPRGVDPLYRAADGTVRRVSDDPHMRQLLKQHRNIQSQAYVARIYMEPTAASRLRLKLDAIQGEWESAVRQPRTSESEASMYGNLRFIGAMALASAPHPIRLY
jgi:hypothetical protein